MSSSAWDAQPWDTQSHDWDFAGQRADSDNDESDGEDATGLAAAEQLCDLLVSLNLCGQLSAKNLCCIAWWACHAGVQGHLADFCGLLPNRGSFKERWTQLLGSRESRTNIIWWTHPDTIDAVATGSRILFLSRCRTNWSSKRPNPLRTWLVR